MPPLRTYPLNDSAEPPVWAAEEHDELLLEALQLRLGKPVRLKQVGAVEFEEGYNRYLGREGDLPLQGSIADLDRSSLSLSDDASIEELRKKSQAEPVIKLVNEIVDRAIGEGATDIHVEPSEAGVQVRLRKDGLLRLLMNLPKWLQLPLVSRIKILAEMDISEKRKPHDGRIRWPYKDQYIDMRVSTLPTRLGEKAVIRILQHSVSVTSLGSLGMPEGILDTVHKLIQSPQGMIFVTGPTGSGKTSTLYACLRAILNHTINVSTIEDPIEYRLEGASQVQVNEKAGLTFANALRSLLRQDPDVILVGEIRDRETAGIAVQAAQTGHLVFSTLHTNDAASAVTRLADLDVESFMIASSVLGILAQRLMRKVCLHCMEMKPPTPREREALPSLPELCPAATGCERCDHTGYQGRTGIFELLRITPEVQEAILGRKSEEVIRKLAGVERLFHDGLKKIGQKISTPTELLRVASLEN